MWWCFLFTKSATNSRKQLTGATLRAAYDDFVLSRQAAGCAPTTLQFYEFTSGKFVAWLEARGIDSPEAVTVRHIREYLAELASRGTTDTTVYDHARAIRTVLIFWNDEGYTNERVKFAMPKVEKKRLLVLDADEVTRILNACEFKRDRAIVALMVDAGVRREEAAALNWGDVDFSSGIVHVKRGKGGKARTVIIGPTARRYLLAYRRELGNPESNAPLFMSRYGERMTGNSLMLLFRRLSKQTGIHVTPHSLRRTFAVLCVRAGMGLLHLQNLLGHESLEMTRHYVNLVESDLLESHKEHSPLDNLARLRKEGRKR